jgi:hypothetical protein
LRFFHDNNKVSPGKLLLIDRIFIVEPGRLGFELIPEKLFCCLASVLVLVADEKDFHRLVFLLCEYKSFGYTTGHPCPKYIN